jgi:quinol-cytochrome oxidoreductase complex cytochrome b subunit
VLYGDWGRLALFTMLALAVMGYILPWGTM